VHAGRVLATLTAMAFAIVPPEAVAQNSRAPIEAGAALTGWQIDRSPDVGPSPAVTTWLDLPLSRRVAIEMRGTFVPSRHPLLLQFSEGSTLYLSAGVRGKFISRPKYSLVGTFSPELIRVSKTVTAVQEGQDIIGTATYFSLGSSLGVEVYPSDRWLARVEVASSTFLASGFELGRGEPGPNGGVLVLVQPARVLTSSELRGGIGLRFGALTREGAETSIDGRWDVGAVFSHATVVIPLDSRAEPRRDVGLGGFGSIKLSNYVYGDGVVTFFFDDPRCFTPYTGGRTLHALGGLKLGPRFDGYGVFAKIRAGINSSSSVLETALIEQRPRVYKRANHFALEIGGVLERELRRRAFVRFDASVLSTFFRSTLYTFEGQPVTVPAPEPSNGLQLSVGIGWRFK
jgi:hypothetical protein